ncbi:MAG TPA: HNH endonuclease signature motif containing protein [Candidatus Saccharimonadales bacterium]|nr:HNH endonuclease signature motif containing protein [Candidatus Saccharimonadales bacterium]
MPDTSRPPTPLPIKRELRQLAGFGCCKCGIPILQYHHIVPYSVEKHFRVKDMMALCPYCHDMATKHILTIEQQRYLQVNPYNMLKGFASGRLILNGSYCAIQTGGVFIVTQGPILSIDGNTLLSLSVGPTNQLEVSVNLYDKKDRLVAVIDKNEWISGDVKLWDIQADHQKLVINKTHGQIELEINTQGNIILIKAKLWYNKQSIRLNSTGLYFNGPANNITVKDLGFVNQRFDIDTQNKTVKITPNVANGIIVSEYDPKLRLQKSIDAWNANFAKLV